MKTIVLSSAFALTAMTSAALAEPSPQPQAGTPSAILAGPVEHAAANTGAMELTETQMDQVTAGKVVAGKATAGKATAGKATAGKATAGKVRRLRFFGLNFKVVRTGQGDFKLVRIK
jgi:hypothetical protein